VSDILSKAKKKFLAIKKNESRQKSNAKNIQNFKSRSSATFEWGV